MLKKNNTIIFFYKEERITAFFVNNLLPKSNLGLTEKLKREDKVNPKPNSSSTKVVLSTRYTIKTSPKIEPKLENKYDNKNYIVKVNYEKEHPRVLIPELCKQFYSNGWVTGTGGGISIKYKDQIFIAPSGVQKERMEPEDLFVQDVNGEDVQCPPPEKQFTKSQCTPIFMCSYIERQAGAVIHTHSPDVVKLSLLNPENEVRISGLEMIKGIYNEEQGRFYNNDEDVIIPIIENSKFERDLVETFQQALKKYPATSAVLVRNHGMYVWGKDWKTAKTQCECYDYCFNILVFKKTNNI
ncbi:probable methylthioribulose-1-phosphate dehydratase isoform X2 [Adelges cooleyi]|uniref:probable methylthioribulose-1-phosphate dehydratase isoform X2 n=1 Tax=Adelges cooleyi TaxID=133065 RepID=UPI00217F6D87|nr:probable methylthioribulose-1-phosphate dehydratase isoform X2 [Adelges cooleyi]